MIPVWFSFIDVAFVMAVILFAWGGYQKGFAAQVAHILAFIILGGLLLFAYPHIQGFLITRIHVNETLIMWGLVALLIGLSVVAFLLISKLLVSMLKPQVTESTDQTFGLLLGMVRGALAALLFMIFLTMLGPQGVVNKMCEKSYTGRFVVYRVVPQIQRYRNSPIVTEGIQKVEDRIRGEREENSRARGIEP